MKKTIVAVFAHPDDEAFGPAGTIYKLAKDNDVFIVCATNGDAGTHEDPKKQREIGRVRAEELRQSAKLLGVKQVFFLGLKDGALSNNLYHRLADKIEEKLITLKADTILTFEPRGVSGHLDHIAISFVSHYVFNKVNSVKTMLQYCIRLGLEMEDYFIYFPTGYREEDADMTIDIEDVWDMKKAAMRLHKSQKKDAERIIKQNENFPKKEFFLVINK